MSSLDDLKTKSGQNHN